MGYTVGDVPDKTIPGGLAQWERDRIRRLGQVMVTRTWLSMIPSAMA